MTDDDGWELSQPTVDAEPDQLEVAPLDYLNYRPEDTIVVSGPLPHNDREGFRHPRMTRREARSWARKRYGRFIESIWHPHLWCIRVFKEDALAKT